jgi:hypothetical protein
MVAIAVISAGTKEILLGLMGNSPGALNARISPV